MTEEEKKQLKEMMRALKPLIELAPEIKEIVRERQEQEIFNRKAAKIGRYLVLICAGIGTVLGSMWAVSKLIFTLGSNA